MANVFIRFSGLSDATGTIQRMPAEFEHQTILAMSQRAYDVAQVGAGRHNRTGALFQSLYNRSIQGGREVGHDLERAPEALFINLGTRPHEIRPKTKKALRWAAGGRFIFAGKVNHPGYRGDAYLIEAATQAVREFREIVDKAFKEST